MTKHSKTRPRLKKITIIVNFSRISSTNYKQARVRAAHRSGIAESHARERSIAQELRIPTRGNGPPLRNRRIPRAVVLHHSGMADFYARERSIAQESRISTRGSSPAPRKCRIPRAVVIYRSGIVFFRVQENSIVLNSN